MIPQRLLDELQRWIDQKKYGEISVKFNAGHIVHMTRTESLKVVLTSGDAVSNVTATACHQPDLL